MINEVHLSGELIDTTMAKISKILRPYFKNCKINQKNRDEIYFKNEVFDFYIYENISIENDFLVEGVHNRSMAAVKKLLNEIVEILDKERIVYFFDCYEDPESDSENKELFEIKHPDYYKIGESYVNYV